MHVALDGTSIHVENGRRSLAAHASMQDPDFQEILRGGWGSPPSFGPAGDLRLYSAAYRTQGAGKYSWFASADWRRGRIQVDRQGAISDFAMAPYGAGGGKVGGEAVEVVPDYSRGSLSLSVGKARSALGKWTATELTLALDDGAARVVDESLACALFLWCVRPAAFLVKAKPPF